MMDAKQTILVVDDESDIIELLKDFLEAEGFAVCTARTGAEALAIADSVALDCILLDIMLPDQGGFELCRQIRERQETPILFLSARDGDADKIRGLGLGADDYVVKSTSLGELVARIRAVLRRYHRTSASETEGCLRFGSLVINLRAHEVQVDGKTVDLTPKEFELLQLLAEHPRQIFTPDQIYAHMWGDFADKHTVRVHIKRLRDKIEPDPAQPRYIVTVWGVGYRFEGGRS